MQARAYNDWASDHTQEGEGRLFAAGAVPPMNDEDGVQAVADEIRRVAEKPGMVSVFLRPNPSVDWRPFNDKVYDPVWQAAADTGLVLAFHPFLDARPARRVPGPEAGAAVRRLELRAVVGGARTGGWELGNILFTQAIANPVDVMHSIAYITAGGVCERFPDTKFLFLEANGGWLVPWLERLDHHSKKFEWDVPWLECCRRSTSGASAGSASTPTSRCWRSPRNSPLCGADRIVWASDYPHPDAKFPGVTEELAEALEPLTSSSSR